MMIIEFVIIPSDKNIRFINKTTGEEADILDVLNLASCCKCKIIKESTIEKISTELKSFGAIDDGIYTTVGYAERNIHFIMILEQATFGEGTGL